MAGDRNVYRFGQYELDAGRRRLTRGDAIVSLPPRQFDLFRLFVSNPNRLLTTDAIMDAAWPGVAVEPNNIGQALKGLRRMLGGDRALIETLPRKGYRFLADVRATKPPSSLAKVEEMLAPHRAFVEGRALLETFDLRAIGRAREVFDAGVATAPDHPDAHIGLANVLMLQFESTRDDAAPAFDLLERAERHAGEACACDPGSGEALATYGFARFLRGDALGAIGTLRRAMALEPEWWLHALRLAYVGWGRERRHAAARVLRECPGLALGCWLTATVLIARRAFNPALAILREGCTAQDHQAAANGAFNAVGLHLLCALVLAALGRLPEALDELARELALADDNHVYGRECRANTWYSFGALLLRLERRDDAVAAFRHALACIPGHRFATVGLAFATGALTPSEADVEIRSVDDSIVKAVILTLLDRHAEGAAIVVHALERAPAGCAGWQLPVEPLLNVSARRREWAEALDVLRHRAL